MSKPKILLLFTGGTIAQVKDPVIGALTPAKTPEDILRLAPELKDYFDIDYKCISNLDSSNIQPKHWAQIAEAISKEYEDYDGFVITHGTDTMSYTASALSFALTNLGKPVVLTGSQLPPDALGSDARNNLINAFRVASMDLAEVVIVFGNRILRGNRSSKENERSFDAFWSPVFPQLGQIATEIEFLGFHKKRNNRTKPIVHAGFEENIMLFTVFPGLRPNYLDEVVEKGAKGVILQGFGAGNLPIKENSLTEEVKKCIEKNIPVVIGSQCPAGVAKTFLYETGITAQRLGAISAEDMTLEATITKLMWALNKTSDMKTIKALMRKNIAGEIHD